ncbi:tetratricopeptide repeat protein [Sphingomonas sanguinis]|uniref:tetratricopeptide repeat protein n=1 Tax=Sphingomonas sp. LC-1 TaxID=3110957 RepID=UPI0021BAC226|nr:tetratricopeptide repeat protein [Sphingomonas sp. LC-1]MCT8001444.1 tetratricopeptide repeat protein [Sphingomonas sp. LC-1]
MILFPLALAAAVQTAPKASTRPLPKPTAPAASLPDDPREARYQRCVAMAERSPAAARLEAGSWTLAGGGYFAQQCLGLAYTTERQWPAAANAFEQAARAAEIAHDVRAANYWAQAGNAFLAAGDATKARAALDAALASGNLTGFARGEAQLDRARALVAAGNPAAARVDLDAALVSAPADPLAWLLSATLARRMKDLPRAQKDIVQALARSADDPSVQLEAGNIAATAGDEAGARKAWSEAARLAPPDSPIRAETAKALAQFPSR